MNTKINPITAGYAIKLIAAIPGKRKGMLRTHGLAEHPDFEIPLPLPVEWGTLRLDRLCEQVKAGRRFQDGELVEGLLDGPAESRPVKLELRHRYGKPIFRLYLADSEGRFFGEIGFAMDSQEYDYN